MLRITRTRTITSTTVETVSISDLSKSEQYMLEVLSATHLNPETALIRAIRAYAREHNLTEEEATHEYLHSSHR